MSADSFKIYVISLPDSSHKREQLRLRFGAVYDRFEIVDGIRLSDTRMLPSPCGEADAKLTRSELGCAMAHLIALEKFIQSGATHALILEDDAIGDAADVAEIEEAIARLPRDAFLLCGGQEGLRAEAYTYGRRSDVPDVYFVPGFVRKFYARACCYCVTVPSANRIIALQRTRLQLSDDWARYFKKWPNFFFTRRISHPLDLRGSTIERERASLIPRSRFERIRRDGFCTVVSRLLSKLALRVFGVALKLVRVV